MPKITKRRIIIALMMPVLYVSIAGNSGCGSSSQNKNVAKNKAQDVSDKLQNLIYVTKHFIEFRNYNLRQKMSDNPATIVWCTFFPPGVQNTTNGSTPGQAFTVPIAGKLTSGGKRPYSAEQGLDGGSDGTAGHDFYSTEVAGPDGMFGQSGDYRYGFDPTLTTYYDFTDLASFCTTEPTVWQAESTKVVVQTDNTLSNLTTQAEAAISSGDPEKALSLLKQAETASDNEQEKKR